MRLTLRTLLAYLDDILDPADARELGQKIEESEFASGLVHRIRSVTRKLRLGAPKLAGKGMGLDANTVAEYLDNTLPQDRVPDFEKVCLESDVQLAEVASCHQILTLVLGEPADVDPTLRERIHALRADVAGTVDQAGGSRWKRELASELLAPPVDRYPAHGETTHDIPPLANPASRTAVADSSARLLPVLGTLVVAFLLALAALVVMGPLDHDHPLLGRFFADAAQVAQGDAAPGDQAEVSAQENPAGANEAVAPDAATDRRGIATAVPPGDLAKSNQPSALVGDPPSAAGGEAPAVGAAAGSLPPPPTLPAVPPAKTPASAAEPAAATESAEPTVMNDPQLDRSKLPPEDTPAGAAAPAELLAQYTSDQHVLDVLARLDAGTGTWPRVATNEPLSAEDRLVALPTYRPQILFSSGVQLVVIGPAELRLVGADADGVPGVVLQSGRFVAMSVGKPDNRLNVQIGDRQSRVTFEDLDATLAVEVRHYLPVGVDPTSREANVVSDAFAAAGRVSWQDAGAAMATPLAATQLITLVDTAEPVLQPLSQRPAWWKVPDEAPIIQAASRQLEPQLEPNRPVTISLQEQVANRLPEVRALAILSLGLFGEFDPFVTALNARELRAFWKDVVDSVRTVQTSSPETAKQVRASFEHLRGEEGQQLYRMLWGFSPEQLADGGAHLLVDALSNPATDMRVLAYINLNEITGKTNFFQPDREPRTQRGAVKSWERDLQQREIIYRTPPVDPLRSHPPPQEAAGRAGTSNVP